MFPLFPGFTDKYLATIANKMFIELGKKPASVNTGPWQGRNSVYITEENCIIQDSPAVKSKKWVGANVGRKLRQRIPAGVIGNAKVSGMRSQIEGIINQQAFSDSIPKEENKTGRLDACAALKCRWCSDCGSRKKWKLQEPCEKTYCSWGATCVVSENGKPLCQCPTDCPSTSEPVCGSDNVTYSNYCHLRKTSCLERKTTRVQHQGACGEYPPPLYCLSFRRSLKFPNKLIRYWRKFDQSEEIKCKTLISGEVKRNGEREMFELDSSSSNDTFEDIGNSCYSTMFTNTV
ncbi:Agrin [Habropoda laboriosa]|uniref:Agrin n=1 Tax=Habropoda laboriosa TaxID=597456 RepID=A0A0L7QZW4_9HYME|nr:Agrin [Habropoda laboriosa]